MSGGRPIFVTGALGFAGCWLIRDLLAAGETVFGFGRLLPHEQLPEQVGPYTRLGPDPTLPGASRYHGEEGEWVFAPCALEEPGALADPLARLEPVSVYHLAAQSSAGLSFRDPQDTFASNVIGTLNLLENLRALPAAKRPVLLAAGSCEEYGPQGRRRVPLTERSPLSPVSPYGVSKVAQSLLCWQYYRSYELPVIVTRAFSHTGPWHDARFVFPSFVQQIVAAERGDRKPQLAVGNLEPVRDFLDVRDVVLAYRRLVAAGEPGQVYNVCSGQALTIQEGLEILLQEARLPIEVVLDADRCRPADIPYMVGDGTKLRQRTGWCPTHEFRATLREMLNWARKENS